MRANKLFIGQNLRELRDEHQLTQARFAEKLGLSTSYLNQLENNQRHVTATVLMALAEQFSVDIASLSKHDSDRLLADLSECFADPLFDGKTPSSRELRLATQNSPSVARALISMHQALRRAGDQLAELDNRMDRSGIIIDPTPYEEVRDYFHFNNNYVHELDVAAESLAHTLTAGKTGNLERLQSLQDHLTRKHHVRVVYTQTDRRIIRSFDPSNRVLQLNARTPRATQAFLLAHQIALLEHHQLINELIIQADFHTDEASSICRMGLANYFAGANLMPYERFHSEAKALRHDLHLLAESFEASIEQVAHRLSTLQRPGFKGVPLFFARVDRAGNITKRHSATKMQFARFGSACPLWVVHRAFESAGHIIRQLAETPDGVRYLCIATTIDKPTGGYADPTQRYALALGCEVAYADEFVYSDKLQLDDPSAFEHIGISCRICEREHCHQRAVPPLKRGLKIDTNVRRILPYSLD